MQNCNGNLATVSELRVEGINTNIEDRCKHVGTDASVSAPSQHSGAAISRGPQSPILVKAKSKLCALGGNLKSASFYADVSNAGKHSALQCTDWKNPMNLQSNK